MSDSMGVTPKSNLPEVAIDDRIGPDAIHLTLRIRDIKRFIHRLSVLEQGKSVNLMKYSSSRTIQIRFVGDDYLKTKILGGA